MTIGSDRIRSDSHRRMAASTYQPACAAVRVSLNRKRPGIIEKKTFTLIFRDFLARKLVGLIHGPQGDSILSRLKRGRRSKLHVARPQFLNGCGYAIFNESRVHGPILLCV